MQVFKFNHVKTIRLALGVSVVTATIPIIVKVALTGHSLYAEHFTEGKVEIFPSHLLVR